jgi:drug/metabolite transporter (DMT)-like permease
VLIKQGLQDMPPLLFAGLRYGLACLILLPLALRRGSARLLRSLPARQYLLLALLGALYYAITQGAQYVALAYLPAVTVSMILNFTGPVVAFLGLALLAEKPSKMQWLGVGLFLGGALVYFYPAQFPVGQAVGLLVAVAGMLSNAFSAVLGRAINRRAHLPPLLVTALSMGAGALLLLAGGLTETGGLTMLDGLSIKSWLMIAWLALVNTALAFTLWNYSLQTLTAMESTIINSTMLVQIALLAWLFLGESLTPPRLAGMALAVLGAVLVQKR